MAFCTRCGKETDWTSKSGYCKECARVVLDQTYTKQRAPLHKRWWFWVVSIFVILVLVRVGQLSVSDQQGGAYDNVTGGANVNYTGETYLEATPSECPVATPEPFDAIEKSGSGDDVVSVSLPDGVYVMATAHNGDGNYSIWDCVGTDKNLPVNTIGAYSGTHILFGGDHDFEITASGDWSLEINEMNEIDTFQCGGSGDTCIGYYTASEDDSAPYRFTHDGERNFTIWMYTSETQDLLVNEIGTYEGKKLLRFSDGEVVVMQVTADGRWSISKSN